METNSELAARNLRKLTRFLNCRFKDVAGVVAIMTAYSITFLVAARAAIIPYTMVQGILEVEDV